MIHETEMPNQITATIRKLKSIEKSQRRMTASKVYMLYGLALKTWPSSWRREGSTGMDTWNAATVHSRQPLTYKLMESVGLGGPRWLRGSWQRGIADSGSSWLSTLKTVTPGDMVWDLPRVQQASYLEGGPLMWILSLYLHVNKKSDDDDSLLKLALKKYLSLLDVSPFRSINSY